MYDPIFGNFENFEQTPPPPPVKLFTITEQMRRVDRERQLAREASAPVNAWKVKASLSVANLSMTTPIFIAGRVREPRVRQLKPKPLGKLCTSCKREMRRHTIYTRCKECREPTTRRSRAKPKIYCANGCGNWIISTSKTGICQDCERKSKCQGYSSALCAGGCGRMLRIYKTHRCDGLCRHCAKPLVRAAWNQRTRKPCKRCEVLVDVRSATGMCRHHAPSLWAYAPKLCKCGATVSMHSKGSQCRKCWKSGLRRCGVRVEGK